MVSKILQQTKLQTNTFQLGQKKFLYSFKSRSYEISFRGVWKRSYCRVSNLIFHVSLMLKRSSWSLLLKAFPLIKRETLFSFCSSFCIFVHCATIKARVVLQSHYQYSGFLFLEVPRDNESSNSIEELFWIIINHKRAWELIFYQKKFGSSHFAGTRIHCIAMKSYLTSHQMSFI